jgi:hypothetical protein
MRTWAKRAGLGFLVLAVAAGGYAVANRTELLARYAGHRFAAAESDEARAESAAGLIALGDMGGPYLVAPFAAGDEAGCRAVVAALKAHLSNVSPTDPAYASALRPLVAAQPTFAPAGAEAALAMVPLVVKCPDADAKAWVRAGLAAPTAAGRARAAGLALLPGVGLAAETAPLLDDPDAAVRRAALLAVGPAADDGPPAVDDESLFRFLHDADAEARELCATALRSRGLDDVQVGLATKLASPDPADRLRLLLDLRSAGESIRDPGPWLERLSRDADPAVRAGAVRVGFEARLGFAGWADRLAAADPDPTVRRLAGYYRGLAAVLQTSGDDGR